MAGIWILVQSTCAQKNQWLDVEGLKAGTPISVLKRARIGCNLITVTDSRLVCDKDMGQVTRRYEFARDQIREVRLETPEHNRMIVGAILGGAAGGFLGFLGGQTSGDPEARVYARVYGIPIGAFIGGAIGVHIHRHGPIVYRK